MVRKFLLALLGLFSIGFAEQINLQGILITGNVTANWVESVQGFTTTGSVMTKFLNNIVYVITPDAQGIQDAIDACDVSGTIYLSAGNYDMTTTANGITLGKFNLNKSNIRFVGGGVGTVLNGYNSNGTVLMNIAASGCIVENLKFVGDLNKSTAFSAIFLSLGYGSTTIKNCYFEDFTGVAIDSNSNEYALNEGDAGNKYLDNRFIASSIQSSPNIAIRHQNYYGLIQDNLFTNYDMAIESNGNFNLVNGNTFKNCTTAVNFRNSLNSNAYGNSFISNIATINTVIQSLIKIENTSGTPNIIGNTGFVVSSDIDNVRIDNEYFSFVKEFEAVNVSIDTLTLRSLQGFESVSSDYVTTNLIEAQVVSVDTLNVNALNFMNNVVVTVNIPFTQIMVPWSISECRPSIDDGIIYYVDDGVTTWNMRATFTIPVDSDLNTINIFYLDNVGGGTNLIFELMVEYAETATTSVQIAYTNSNGSSSTPVSIGFGSISGTTNRGDRIFTLKIYPTLAYNTDLNLGVMMIQYSYTAGNINEL